MAKKTKPTSDAAWAKAFSVALRDSGNKPSGDGWFTLQDVAKRDGISIPQARRRLAIIRKSYEVEMFDGCVVQGTTRVRQVWWRIIA